MRISGLTLFLARVLSSTVTLSMILIHDHRRSMNDFLLKLRILKDNVISHLHDDLNAIRLISSDSCWLIGPSMGCLGSRKKGKYQLQVLLLPAAAILVIWH